MEDRSLWCHLPLQVAGSWDAVQLPQSAKAPLSLACGLAVRVPVSRMRTALCEANMALGGGVGLRDVLSTCTDSKDRQPELFFSQTGRGLGSRGQRKCAHSLYLWVSLVKHVSSSEVSGPIYPPSFS